LGSSDIAALKAQQFSANEACYLVRISAQVLHQWHWQGLEPEAREMTGRGHRRHYGFQQIAHLLAMRTLSKSNVPLKLATIIAESLLVPQIEGAFDAVCAAGTVGAAEQAYPVLVAVYDTNEEAGREQFAVATFRQGKRLGEDAGLDLGSWMHRQSISDAIVISPTELAFWLWFGIEEVLAGRGDPAFHEVLQEHLAGFKRRRPAGGAAAGAQPRRSRHTTRNQ
jgi:hypothetical protein